MMMSISEIMILMILYYVILQPSSHLVSRNELSVGPADGLVVG